MSIPPREILYGMLQFSKRFLYFGTQQLFAWSSHLYSQIWRQDTPAIQLEHALTKNVSTSQKREGKKKPFAKLKGDLQFDV